jgi:hypothetical protein
MRTVRKSKEIPEGWNDTAVILPTPNRSVEWLTPYGAKILKGMYTSELNWELPSVGQIGYSPRAWRYPPRPPAQAKALTDILERQLRYAVRFDMRPGLDANKVFVVRFLKSTPEGYKPRWVISNGEYCAEYVWSKSMFWIPLPKGEMTDDWSWDNLGQAMDVALNEIVVEREE